MKRIVTQLYRTASIDPSDVEVGADGGKGGHDRYRHGYPPELQGLVEEARKFQSYEEFERAFLGEIRHGQYWHLTDNPNFSIDPTRGPRDMSSISGGQTSPGKLMITSHFENWDSYYNDPDNPERGVSRPYAAEIDMRGVPSKAYWQVNRGFGNEFWVDDPSGARVARVVPVEEARKRVEEYNDLLPRGREELRSIWDRAHDR
jgi:hypothetical protein